MNKIVKDIAIQEGFLSVEQEMKFLEDDKNKIPLEIEKEKERYAASIKSGLGNELNDFKTYDKKVSIFKKLKTKIHRFFKYL